ncbi:MAG: hypothetical protein AB1758_13605, partial [Candidatus Eremiobacterota bacterium]
MGLSPELLDTVELTALLRRHQRFGSLRRGLETCSLRVEDVFLLTLDGDRELQVGLLLTREGVAHRFEVDRAGVRTREERPCHDELVSSTARALAEQS